MIILFRFSLEAGKNCNHNMSLNIEDTGRLYAGVRFRPVFLQWCRAIASYFAGLNSEAEEGPVFSLLQFCHNWFLHQELLLRLVLTTLPDPNDGVREIKLECFKFIKDAELFI